MNVLYGYSQQIADWTASRIDDCARGFGDCQALGVWSDGLIAGVVFHNWHPESGVIEVSAAAEDPRWAQRTILTELFEYPFDEIGCRMVVTRTSEKNERVRKLWRAFGAKETVIPDLRADGEAEIVFTLKREDWQKSRLYNG